MEIISTDSKYSIVTCDQKIKNLFAWNHLMPTGSHSFHVNGLVKVPNPGVACVLQYKSPQGINPEVLLLDLVCIQKQGTWPSLMRLTEVNYTATLDGLKYSKVSIFCNNEMKAEVDVVDIHKKEKSTTTSMN